MPFPSSAREARPRWAAGLACRRRGRCRLAPPSAGPAGALDAVDTVVLDCDGVLWRGDEAVPGSAEAVAELRRRGKRLLFLTNNATKTRAQAAAKFAKLGFEGVAERDVVTAARSAARYLAVNAPPATSAFVLGSAGLASELADAGVEVVRGPEARGGVDLSAPLSDADFARMDVSGLGAVVVSQDTAVTFAKLAYASKAVQAGALFVATNLDAADVVAGALIPGAGAVAAAVSVACGKQPDVNCGKPGAWIMELLESEYGVDLKRTAVVGDRIDTDIALGRRNGAALTVLTLTGVATESDVAAADPEDRPDLVVPRLCDVLSAG